MPIRTRPPRALAVTAALCTLSSAAPARADDGLRLLIDAPAGDVDAIARGIVRTFDDDDDDDDGHYRGGWSYDD